MKSLHDDELSRALESDPMAQPVILWPNINTHKDGPTMSGFVSMNDLVGENVILLAMEGTWRQARRMASKFSYPRLSLENISKATNTSLLAPLRAPKTAKDSVCTAEAVIAALEGLGMESDPEILNIVRRKVDQTRRYQGKQAKGTTF